MAKAKSISAANLSKLTQASVKALAPGIPGKFIGKGPTMGFILQQGFDPSEQLKLAGTITAQVSENAKAAGIAGLKPQPVVVVRPGKIIVGFMPPEIGIIVRP